MQQVILLELNEVNIPAVQKYTQRGELPFLGYLLSRYGLAETTSEDEYEAVEPWIQWVTAHTGRTLAEHCVFRLGDIVKYDLPQIWEVLESAGVSVGAIAPMNAKNRCEKPAFFVPDPWTRTHATGGQLLRRLCDSVAQAVNDNARAYITPHSAVWLAAGLARYSQLKNYRTYWTFILNSSRQPWAKAMLLDRLLADVFIHEAKRKRPNFASLFLNAAAHIQHHYMFNSSVYEGRFRNPSWYIDEEADPVLDIYRIYDRIVSDIAVTFPESRLMIATGLHQDPYPKECYYWRLIKHDDFLRNLSIRFDRVEPRMSRDFVIHCHSAHEAQTVERSLYSITDERGKALFCVDNRGTDLFVTLTYPHEIHDDLEFVFNNRSIGKLRPHVSFVAIKNGQHNGIGYFIDTGAVPKTNVERFALADLPIRICDAFGVQWSS